MFGRWWTLLESEAGGGFTACLELESPCRDRLVDLHGRISGTLCRDNLPVSCRGLSDLRTRCYRDSGGNSASL